MERDKAIKIGVASVLGLVAVIILAMNLFGGGAPKEAEDAPPPPPADERSGGGRLAPGADPDI